MSGCGSVRIQKLFGGGGWRASVKEEWSHLVWGKGVGGGGVIG